ncbi:CoxG family protein [Novosphingobium sp. TH158]|uniref:CoxG family protein n=1 Tax=Novosphingobium sp. TH158 TaxID=2067455 RepID=UPI000C7DD06B|nr:carbon monoxide dehydrogenase subunit G [Novosphingobium sp. TH158]PLK27492.1 carbon monoxide dehydrogenase [Novosphingobium sp. TH158]
MQMTGEQRIAAPRQRVWEALNDPAVLSQCIPGCQSLEKQADDRFAAVAEVKIGPIGARFKGNVQLSDIDAPNGYTISGSGNGGVAGNARGGAKVRLSDDGAGGTIVAYTVEAEVGGRMAQLGGPIIDATARNLAGKFFTRFGEVVIGTAASAPAAGAPTQAATSAPAPSLPRAPAGVGGTGLWGWVAALLAAILVGYYLGAHFVSGGLVSLVLALLVIVAAAAYEAGKRSGGK